MTEDMLAAKLIGRWRSGTPLARAPYRDNRSAQDPEQDNNFRYADDPRGYKTPLFAHIRKIYPRDERFHDDRRRIIRRGIPFGQPFNPAAGRGHGVDADRGLCFNAFMADIEEQFEYLQRNFANEANFPPDTAPTGPDLIIGANPKPFTPVRLQRPDMTDTLLTFKRFVHTTGAVYAFAPSLKTLRMLARGEL